MPAPAVIRFTSPGRTIPRFHIHATSTRHIIRTIMIRKTPRTNQRTLLLWQRALHRDGTRTAQRSFACGDGLYRLQIAVNVNILAVERCPRAVCDKFFRGFRSRRPPPRTQDIENRKKAVVTCACRPWVFVFASSKRRKMAHKQKKNPASPAGFHTVEHRRIELLTFCLQSRCSTN